MRGGSRGKSLRELRITFPCWGEICFVFLHRHIVATEWGKVFPRLFICINVGVMFGVRDDSAVSTFGREFLTNLLTLDVETYWMTHLKNREEKCKFQVFLAILKYFLITPAARQKFLLKIHTKSVPNKIRLNRVQLRSPSPPRWTFIKFLPSCPLFLQCLRFKKNEAPRKKAHDLIRLTFFLTVMFTVREPIRAKMAK